MLEEIRNPQYRPKGIDSQVIFGGVSIRNMLIPAFEVQRPAFGEEIARSNSDIEIELEGLADNAAADVGSC